MLEYSDKSLDSPVSSLKGVGQKRRDTLNSMGIFTLRDVLYHAPYKYIDLSSTTQIINACHGHDVVLQAKVISEPVVRHIRSRLSITTFYIDDGSSTAQCVYYNQPYIAQNIKKEMERYFIGKVDLKHGVKQIINPVIEKIDDARSIVAYYSLKKGVSNPVFSNLAGQAIEIAPGSLKDELPESIRVKFNLPEINYCIHQIHFPDSIEEAQKCRYRLTFEELLFFMAALEAVKNKRAGENGIVFTNADAYLIKFLPKLGFELTSAQKKAIDEIIRDISSGQVMNRLVQGDVGSGKTAVAAAALYICAMSGHQGALMAPTEILARQHYDYFNKLFEPLGIKTGLLTGSMSAQQKREILGKIGSGEINVAIGTHALIQDDVGFKDLALAVTDEQHRFGVRQRAELKGKGTSPHLLVMSATPVPRTLALIVYGDLDISIIDELPPGRKPVITKIVPVEKRDDMYEYINTEIKKGNQAYIVCPLIDESEKLEAVSAQELFEDLKQGALKSADVALLHGRMKEDEKNGVLDAFRAGKIKAIVSTTVIEVGVNVKNATIMVIENAERFGLAQLHQLRGRVGRGEKQSWCFLVCGGASEESVKRISIMAKSNDGFEIAQEDLKQRGPGEFLGTRQSGMIDKSILSLMNDARLISVVRDAMDQILDGNIAVKNQIFGYALNRYEHHLKKLIMN